MIDLDEIKKSIPDFIKREREKTRSLEAFFASIEFNKMMEVIKENVSRTDIKYEADRAYGLPSADFDHVCSAIYSVLADQAKVIPSEFIDYAIDYQGIRFGLLIGQGAIYWAKKIDDTIETNP